MTVFDVQVSRRLGCDDRVEPVVVPAADLTPAAHRPIDHWVSRRLQLNDAAGVEWLISFLSADKKKTYCLYEASSAEEIREAARRNGVPADVIVEVGELSALGAMGGVQPQRFSD